eukprot:3781521-Rhodomonas_salina.3
MTLETILNLNLKILRDGLVFCITCRGRRSFPSRRMSHHFDRAMTCCDVTCRLACVQITLGLFALLFFFSAFIWGQPNRSAFPNTLQAYIQLTLCITLYCQCKYNQRVRLGGSFDHVPTPNLCVSCAAAGCQEITGGCSDSVSHLASSSILPAFYRVGRQIDREWTI